MLVSDSEVVRQRAGYQTAQPGQLVRWDEHPGIDDNCGVSAIVAHRPSRRNTERGLVDEVLRFTLLGSFLARRRTGRTCITGLTHKPDRKVINREEKLWLNVECAEPINKGFVWRTVTKILAGREVSANGTVTLRPSQGRS